MRCRRTLHSARARFERGVVMFIALIVMVALSLAGVALVRSVDTTTAVVGNLAFRQSALLPANLAVEQANAALFKEESPTGSAAIPDREKDTPAENYFARLQNDDDERGIPKQLQKLSNWTLPKILYPDADKQFSVRYVIERTCMPAAPLPLDASTWTKYCDTLSPKPTSGTTIHDGSPPTNPPRPFYRLTVRVDGPKNTTAFLQAMLR